MSAITDKWLKAVPLYTDTLAGAISNATVTTFQVTNGSTDLENGEVYEVTIDRVTAQGVLTGRREVVIAQYTSATKTFDCSSADYRGIEGTAQAHPVGAVVEILVTAHYLNEHRAAFLVGHTQAGAHASALPLTSPVLTTPKVVTSINDANGNEVIKTPATTNAVNEITLTNAATGNAVAIAATGGDDNINLDLSGKGTGVVRTTNQLLTTPTLTTPVLQGNVDGWILANESWAYASASTITVPAGAASKYRKGDKIKLTQTTVKYFYVVGVADTVLTVTGGSDYTVANAAITLNYYSHSTSPIGFPDSFNTAAVSFSTTYTDNGSGVAVTSSSSKFIINGNVCSHSMVVGGSYKVNTNTTWSSHGIPATMPTLVTFLNGSGYLGLANRLVVVTQYGAGGSSVFCASDTNITDNTQSNGWDMGYSYLF